MVVARCGHVVGIRNRSKFEIPDAGQVNSRRIIVNGLDLALDGSVGIATGSERLGSRGARQMYFKRPPKEVGWGAHL